MRAAGRSICAAGHADADRGSPAGPKPNWAITLTELWLAARPEAAHAARCPHRAATPASQRYGQPAARRPHLPRPGSSRLLAGLRDLQGARLVADLGGVKATRAALQGADGTR